MKEMIQVEMMALGGSVDESRGSPQELRAVARLASDDTLVGNHIATSSVLRETHDWLAALPASVDFVEPEIGMMAQAAVRSGIRFGYLRLISDNVAEKYAEDLSNERMQRRRVSEIEAL